MTNSKLETRRILAVDPGDKRLGIALSDPTATLASPLTILDHKSRKNDAREIIRLAENNAAKKIVIGQALDWDGEISQQGRKAARLAAAVEQQTTIPVTLWNEYGSTNRARKALLEMGVSRKKRNQPLDDLAATVILQSYLDAQIRKNSR